MSLGGSSSLRRAPHTQQHVHVVGKDNHGTMLMLADRTYRRIYQAVAIRVQDAGCCESPHRGLPLSTHDDIGAVIDHAAVTGG